MALASGGDHRNGHDAVKWRGVIFGNIFCIFGLVYRLIVMGIFGKFFLDWVVLYEWMDGWISGWKFLDHQGYPNPVHTHI